MTDDGGPRPKYIPWRTLFRRMAREFKMGPNEVGDLTMRQLWAYAWEPRDPGQQVKVQPAEAIKIRRNYLADRQAFLDSYFSKG